MRFHYQRVSSIAVVVFTMAFAAPVHAETEVVEAYSSTGGLTRDSLSDASLSPSASSRSATVAANHHRKAAADPKDFVATRSHRRHHEARQPQSQVTVTKGSKRRNPVGSFVFWWNGWVIRTFHTKIGTVMLGTVGAKT